MRLRLQISQILAMSDAGREENRNSSQKIMNLQWTSMSILNKIYKSG